MSAWTTAITNVRPNEIRLRGYRLDDMAGRLSYGSAILLAITGELPSPGDGRLIDTILVSCVDHGATPPSTLAARTAASTGAPMNAALAAGILSINAHHGGAIERCMGHLSKVARIERSGTVSRAQAAAQLVQDQKKRGSRLSGFGHRVHSQDPRVERLFKVAGDEDRRGDWIDRAKKLAAALSDAHARKINLNVDGAIAAVLLELGIPPEYANALFITARLPGLMAHIHEEVSREKPMRRINPEEHSYDGPPDRDYPEADSARGAEL